MSSFRLQIEKINVVYDNNDNTERKRQIDRQTDRLIDRQIDKQIGRQINRQTDRQIDTKIDRQIDRQIYTKIDRQIVTFPFPMASQTTERKSMKGSTTRDT